LAVAGSIETFGPKSGDHGHTRSCGHEIWYGSGVTVLTTDQCPYLPDAVDIFERASKELGLSFQVLKLNSAKQAQNNGANPNGTFAVLYNGQVVTYKYEKLEKFKLMMKNFMRK
jgi:hypothetical protein